MKVLNIIAVLLIGSMVGGLQAGGKIHPLFEKHYEDQLHDDEMGIEEYLDVIERYRLNRAEWKKYSIMLQKMRMSQDGRYANVIASLNQPLMEYKSAHISRPWFIKEVKEIIQRNYR